MFKRIFAVAAAASLSVLGGTAAAQAQAQSTARPAGHLHGVRVVNLHRAYEARLGHTRPGKISGIVYARGKQPKAARGSRAIQGTCAEPDCPGDAACPAKNPLPVPPELVISKSASVRSVPSTVKVNVQPALAIPPLTVQLPPLLPPFSPVLKL